MSAIKLAEKFKFEVPSSNQKFKNLHVADVEKTVHEDTEIRATKRNQEEMEMREAMHKRSLAEKRET
jgi:hypothetical protein